MFSALNISQLIADDLSSVDFCVNIGVRVTIYPHVNPAICDIFVQVDRKCSIEWTLFMMRCYHCHCREMMSHHHDMLRIALSNTLLDEGKTFLMLIIEVARQKHLPAISDLEKSLIPCQIVNSLAGLMRDHRVVSMKSVSSTRTTLF